MMILYHTPNHYIRLHITLVLSQLTAITIWFTINSIC